MRAYIRGYASACFETAISRGDIDAVVSDLAAFSRALSTFDSLRQVLVDPGISVVTRCGVVNDLLSDKATTEAASLLGFAVQVERPSELPSSVASLVVFAETAAQDASFGIPAELELQSARSGVRERIRGYVERVLQELSAINEVDEVEDELFRIARLIDDNPILRQTFQDSSASYAGKVAVLHDLLQGRAQPATLRLAAYVLRAGRSRDLVGTFEWLVELAAEERGRRVAEVRAAVDLDDEERDRVAVALSRLVDRNVEVRVVIDPSVIGGVLITVGDLVIDGTVRFRFEQLRDLLTQPN